VLQVKEDPKAGEELARRGNAVYKACVALVVCDDASYAVADKMLSETKNLENRTVNFWADTKMWAHKTWKSIVDKERQMRVPISDGSKVLARKMSDYRYARGALKERERKEEQEKRSLDMKVKALELAEQGVPQVAVDGIIAMSAEPLVVRETELRGKTSFVLSYEVEIKAGEEHLIPREILEPTTTKMKEALISKVKAIAKTSGGKQIEGLNIIQTSTARRRNA
tara:strand:- start:247 stop:921 length:675 start_codon:yes stop_codon:yes gene_type:complete